MITQIIDGKLICVINKNMDRKLKNSGQAPIEMAIFGTLILLCLGAFLSYAQRFDAQQQVMMETFRKALNAAYSNNNSVTYTYNKPVRFANLFGGYKEGQSSAVRSASLVMWVKGTAGPSGTKGEISQGYYQFGNQALLLPQHPKEVFTIRGDTTEVKVTEGVWKQDVQKEISYRGNIEKNESSTGITNSRNASLNEQDTIVLHTRWDKAKSDPRERWDDPTNVPDYEYNESMPEISYAESDSGGRAW